MLFQKYQVIIESIIQGIKTGTTSATFTDYLWVIGTSLLIMLIIGASIALLIAAIKAPKLFIDKMTKTFKDEINKLAKTNGKMSDADIQKSLELEKKLKKRIRLCIGGIIFVYLPVVVPTFLILVDCLLRVF